ncbi:MAG TPA: histone deacetylase [Acidimicrobiales bacterium]
MTVLVVSDPRCLDHDSGPGHPERPGRLTAVLDGVAALGGDAPILEAVPRPAPAELIGAVHTDDHVTHLDHLAGSGGGWVDADTHVGPDSMEAARVAAGAGLEAVHRLRAGDADAAFCAVRPPGHHARPAQAMGFCLLNNVAVTARALAAAGERVLIVDWDAHHGNGAQDVFWDDPAVLVASIHQWPLYPGTGSVEETGGPAAPGGIINVPVPAGTTGEHYLAALDQLVAPASEAHGTTWVLVSAGFDSHRLDPLTNLGLTAGDYAAMTRMVMDLAPPRRHILVLEGGYDLGAVQHSTTAVVATLADVPLAAAGLAGPDAGPSHGGPGDASVRAATEAHRRATGG